MRIRKRQAFSSLAPLHLSDPYLVNRSPVVVQLGDDAATTHTAPKPPSSSQHAAAEPSTLDRYQPSHQQLQLIGKPFDDPSGIGKSGAHNKQQQHPLEEKVKGEEEEEESGGEKGNHTSKGGILVSQHSPSSSTLAAQDGRWWVGEKAIPLKKRRGSFENGMMVENNKKMKAKMKTKMNKKCNVQKGEDDEEEQLDVKAAASSKKRTKGSAVMEGSRCSRVNGRGWRCCQQTLVGYSLCEHHLGKGRLRSMTSVRNRSIGTTTTTNAPNKVVHDSDKIVSVVSGDSSSSSIEMQATNSGNGVDDGAFDNDDDDEKMKKKKMKKGVITSTKKRMKLGMVKARSISSLLGQTNTQLAHVVADEEMINHNNK